MKQVNIYKAQPTSDPVESVRIEIDQVIPRFKELFLLDDAANEEGIRLEDALYNSLPGAIYDRLLGHMLARKSTHFIVKHGA